MDHSLEDLFEIMRIVSDSSSSCGNQSENASEWCDHYDTCNECRAALIDAIERKIADEYVRLPKDANGKPIHMGDVMDGVNKYDTLQEVTGTVITISFDATLDPDDSTSVGIRVWADDHKSYRGVYIDPHASIYRHHNELTVEDVLYDSLKHFGAVEKRTPEVDSWVCEQAAKLRKMLAGDAE